MKQVALESWNSCAPQAHPTKLKLKLLVRFSRLNDRYTAYVCQVFNRREKYQLREKYKTAFVSGANRGIGLELSIQLAKKGYEVIAGYRQKDRSIRLLETAQERKEIRPIKVDVTIEDELRSLYDDIADRFGYLDILINNAGININPARSMKEIEWTEIIENFRVNVGGPFQTVKYLYPLLKKGKEKKIINISSQMGSIELSSGSATPYRISKAALNMLTKNQSIEYRSDGITVISIHPGWVKTDMGGKSAPLSVEESADRILKIVDEVSFSNSGEFISIHGDLLPY